MKFLFVVFVGIVLLSSCNQKNNRYEQSTDTSTSHHVIVKELLQTSSYSYLYVAENEQNYWMAVSRIDAKVGDDLYYEDAMEMKDFKSKELDRTFERILFIQNISNVPLNSKSSSQVSLNHSKEKTTELNEDIQVEPAPDGITIAELYKNRNNYRDKKVVVRGKVVKINNNIMNQNWVHLQDGTDDSGNYDLTITTQETLNVGDVVTLVGTVALNKDFGAGYSYDLIIEGAYLK